MDNAINKYKQRRDARIKKRMDAFEESDHPRDENGRFTSGGGSEKKSGAGAKVKTGGGKAEISESAVRSAVGDKKTQKAISSALKSAGYRFKDKSSESGYPNFYIEDGDGGRLRVYVAGSGRAKSIKVQRWRPVEAEAIKGEKEISDAKKRVKDFAEKVKGKDKIDFNKLGNEQKWCYIAATMYKKHMGYTGDEKKAWSRAIDSANGWREKGYKGYEDGMKSDKEEEKEFISGIIDGMKRSAK